MANGKSSDNRSHEQLGTPNWRNPADYLYVRDLTPACQRWECLRRTPAYRDAWDRHGRITGGFGLERLLDPSHPATQLKREPIFLDSRLAGGALGIALPSPSLSSMLLPLSAAKSDAVALHYGRQILDLVESGYVLFVTDPSLSSSTQAKRIEDQLSKFQKEARKENAEVAHRLNYKTAHTLDKLLRVLDAYEQEGISVGRGRYGAKRMIGEAIFGDVKIENETSWHKVADAAFQRALRIGTSPVLK